LHHIRKYILHYITIGLGIIIGGKLISLIYNFLFEIGVSQLEISRYQSYMESLYIPSIIISILITRAISLKERVAANTKGLLFLTAGVWLFLVDLVFDLLFKFYPWPLVFLPESLTNIFIKKYYIVNIFDSLILIGLFMIILCAKQVESTTKS